MALDRSSGVDRGWNRDRELLKRDVCGQSPSVPERKAHCGASDSPAHAGDLKHGVRPLTVGWSYFSDHPTRA